MNDKDYSHELVEKVTRQDRAWKDRFSSSMKKFGLDPRPLGSDFAGDFCDQILERFSCKEVNYFYLPPLAKAREGSMDPIDLQDYIKCSFDDDVEESIRISNGPVDLRKKIVTRISLKSFTCLSLKPVEKKLLNSRVGFMDLFLKPKEIVYLFCNEKELFKDLISGSICFIPVLLDKPKDYHSISPTHNRSDCDIGLICIEIGSKDGDDSFFVVRGESYIKQILNDLDLYDMTKPHYIFEANRTVRS